MKECPFVKAKHFRKKYMKYLLSRPTICIIMGGKDMLTSEREQRASQEGPSTDENIAKTF
jgi:hypothetical protein